MKEADKIISNSHHKKAGRGFTLIEIAIVIVIAGIIFGFGGIYFISSWRNFRVSAQNVNLQRAARYAMDYIINGTMVEGNHDEYFRHAGIISAHRVNTIDGGKGIEMYGRDNVLIGRIRLGPNNTSLLFIDETNNSHTIIPIESNDFNESTSRETYTIEIFFTRNEQDPSLIRIQLGLTLDSDINREHRVEMFSLVSLQNYYDIIIHRNNIQ